VQGWALADVIVSRYVWALIGCNLETVAHQMIKRLQSLFSLCALGKEAEHHSCTGMLDWSGGFRCVFEIIRYGNDVNAF
jgi:hypothetical protein